MNTTQETATAPEINGKIYALRFPNGKSYVGQTTCELERRLGDHRRTATLPSGHPKRFPVHSAIAKYGWENVHADLIMDGIADRESLDAAEMFFVMEFGAFVDQGGGYNLTAGGGGSGEMSAETRAKLSAAMTGKRLTAEHRANIAAGMTGKVLPPEHRANISAALANVPKSPETRARMSAAQAGRSKRPEWCRKLAASMRRYHARRRKIFSENP